MLYYPEKTSKDFVITSDLNGQKYSVWNLHKKHYSGDAERAWKKYLDKVENHTLKSNDMKKFLDSSNEQNDNNHNIIPAYINDDNKEKPNKKHQNKESDLEIAIRLSNKSFNNDPAKKNNDNEFTPPPLFNNQINNYPNDLPSKPIISSNIDNTNGCSKITENEQINMTEFVLNNQHLFLDGKIPKNLNEYSSYKIQHLFDDNETTKLDAFAVLSQYINSNINITQIYQKFCHNKLNAKQIASNNDPQNHIQQIKPKPTKFVDSDSDDDDEPLPSNKNKKKYVDLTQSKIKITSDGNDDDGDDIIASNLPPQQQPQQKPMDIEKVKEILQNISNDISNLANNLDLMKVMYPGVVDQLFKQYNESLLIGHNNIDDDNNEPFMGNNTFYEPGYNDDAP